MTELTIPIQVIGINPDTDQMTGDQYTVISLAKEITVDSHTPSNPSSTRSIKSWKYILTVSIPNNEWNDQYKIWQKYNLIIKDNGELELKQS